MEKEAYTVAGLREIDTELTFDEIIDLAVQDAVNNIVAHDSRCGCFQCLKHAQSIKRWFSARKKSRFKIFDTPPRNT